MLSGGLGAPEEADSKGFSASEENDLKTWMKGDCCYEVPESKIHEEHKRKNAYEL